MRNLQRRQDAQDATGSKHGSRAYLATPTALHTLANYQHEIYLQEIFLLSEIPYFNSIIEAARKHLTAHVCTYEPRQ